MTVTRQEVIVAGAGPAGLAAACLLAQGGYHVTCIAPESRPDPRTVALMAPSLRLLESIGIWNDSLQPNCAPLKQLHLLDDTGNLVSAPDLRFAASEAGLEAFGWNVPLVKLIPALHERATDLGVVFHEAQILSADCTDTGVVVSLSNGETCIASFAVAADGRDSLLRKAAGIQVTKWSFDQSALVTRFAHSRDHEGISTEWHKLGGPFTTVPLPGKHSALVWMDKPQKIEALLALSPQQLAREIQLQNHGSLGLISDVAPAHAFAMRGVKADAFAARRVYLVGEAAHVFPPVGAQGLNMSLRDAGHMLDVVDASEDPGCTEAMARYDALRRSDVLPRQTAISMMNRSLLADVLPPHLLRATGLAAVAYLKPLREMAIREGLSPSGGLPHAMRA